MVDDFRLPDLWSLHLYDYTALLEVDQVPYAITPGCVSLVPPGAQIRYRYEGPSRHLYAHLRARPAPIAVISRGDIHRAIAADSLAGAGVGPERAPQMGRGIV